MLRPDSPGCGSQPSQYSLRACLTRRCYSIHRQIHVLGQINKNYLHFSHSIILKNQISTRPLPYHPKIVLPSKWGHARWINTFNEPIFLDRPVPWPYNLSQLDHSLMEIIIVTTSSTGILSLIKLQRSPTQQEWCMNAIITEIDTLIKVCGYMSRSLAKANPWKNF